MQSFLLSADLFLLHTYVSANEFRHRHRCVVERSEAGTLSPISCPSAPTPPPSLSAYVTRMYLISYCIWPLGYCYYLRCKFPVPIDSDNPSVKILYVPLVLARCRTKSKPCVLIQGVVGGKCGIAPIIHGQIRFAQSRDK